MTQKMINRFFAVNDEFFMNSVKLAQDKGEKIEATVRQASKFRNQKGIAFRYRKAALRKKEENEKSI